MTPKFIMIQFVTQGLDYGNKELFSQLSIPVLSIEQDKLTVEKLKTILCYEADKFWSQAVQMGIID